MHEGANVYAVVERRYRSKVTGEESLLLRDVISDTVTLRPFNVGGRKGTWRGSPFVEVETLMPDIPGEIRNLNPKLVLKNVPRKLFDAITDSIERSWREDKFHVIFHSSGYD